MVYDCFICHDNTQKMYKPVQKKHYVPEQQNYTGDFLQC